MNDEMKDRVVHFTAALLANPSVIDLTRGRVSDRHAARIVATASLLATEVQRTFAQMDVRRDMIAAEDARAARDAKAVFDGLTKNPPSNPREIGRRIELGLTQAEIQAAEDARAIRDVLNGSPGAE